MSAEITEACSLNFSFPSGEASFYAERRTIDGVSGLATNMTNDDYLSVFNVEVLQRGVWSYGDYLYVPCFLTPEVGEEDEEGADYLYHLSWDSKANEFSFIKGDYEDYSAGRGPELDAKWVTTAEFVFPKVRALYEVFGATRARNIAARVKGELEGIGRPFPTLYASVTVLEGEERTSRGKEYSVMFMDSSRILLLKNEPILLLGNHTPPKKLQEIGVAELGAMPREEMHEV